MKKILIIASEFPPRGVGNVLRTVKLVKHLPSFGWQPYVLTISLGSIERFDHSYDNEVPKEARVIRALYPNPFVFLDRRWHQREKTRVPENRQPVFPAFRLSGSPPPRLVRALASSGKRVTLWLISSLRRHTLIPGWLMAWLPFAVAKGVWICFREGIDFIYSTAPSYENHLVGLLIKMLTGRKWMADYRDLWTDYPTRRISSKFRKKVEESMDALVLGNADAVNIVSPRWRDFLLRRFPFLSPEKVTCYTNGFDSEDYLTGPRFGEGKPHTLYLGKDNLYTPSLGKDSSHTPSLGKNSPHTPPLKRGLGGFAPQRSGPNQWRITYAGSILRGYPTPLFLKALGELCGEIPEMRREVKVNFYGDIRDGQLAQINEMIERFSLQENVSINGSIPRQDALRIMESSDLLLLMYIVQKLNTDGCIPAKIFEYIGVRKPVFAIVPKDGSAAEIMQKGKMGMIASPSAYEEIKDGLKRLYLDHKYADKAFQPNWDYLSQFDRGYIVGKLADIFDHLAFQPEVRT